MTMSAPAWVLAVLYLLWVLYLAAQALNRARVDGTWRLPARVLGWPVILVTVLLDITINWTLATVVFMDRAREPTLSQRLSRYLAGDGWRRAWAAWIGANLLDPFDPSGSHLRRP